MSWRRMKLPNSNRYIWLDMSKQSVLEFQRGEMKLSFWDNPEFLESEFDIWSPLNDGTPTEIKIIDWENIKVRDFPNGKRSFIETNLGWLRIDSMRLKRQLVQFKNFKGILIIQRWVNPDNSYDTQYKVLKKSQTKEISKKK